MRGLTPAGTGTSPGQHDRRLRLLSAVARAFERANAVLERPSWWEVLGKV